MEEPIRGIEALRDTLVNIKNNTPDTLMNLGLTKALEACIDYASHIAQQAQGVPPPAQNNTAQIAAISNELEHGLCKPISMLLIRNAADRLKKLVAATSPSANRYPKWHY